MVEKLWRYVKPFSYNTSVSRTDRQTELRYQYRASAAVCWRAIKVDKMNALPCLGRLGPSSFLKVGVFGDQRRLHQSPLSSYVLSSPNTVCIWLIRPFLNVFCPTSLRLTTGSLAVDTSIHNEVGFLRVRAMCPKWIRYYKLLVLSLQWLLFLKWKIRYSTQKVEVCVPAYILKFTLMELTESGVTVGEHAAVLSSNDRLYRLHQWRGTDLRLQRAWYQSSSFNNNYNTQ